MAPPGLTGPGGALFLRGDRMGYHPDVFATPRLTRPPSRLWGRAAHLVPREPNPSAAAYLGAGLLTAAAGYGLYRLATRPGPLLSAQQQAAGLVLSRPQASVGDLTNQLYAQLWPGCPAKLDPQDPTHFECIENWQTAQVLVEDALEDFCVWAPGTHAELVAYENKHRNRRMVIAAVPRGTGFLLAEMQALCRADPNSTYIWIDMSRMRGPYKGARFTSTVGQFEANAEHMVNYEEGNIALFAGTRKGMEQSQFRGLGAEGGAQGHIAALREIARGR